MASYYPAFLDLRGRPCIVIGAGEVAERKVGALLQAGARVTVISSDGTEGLARLADGGALLWRRRPYRPGDLSGAWITIAATDDPSVNQAVAEEADARQVLLNVVDQSGQCSFIAPSVVQRGDLTIAISTGGKSPAMARRVREEMERHFPPEWGGLLDVAADAREALMSEGTRPDADLWQEALSDDLVGLVRDGRRTEATERLLEVLRRGGPAAG